MVPSALTPNRHELAATCGAPRGAAQTIETAARAQIRVVGRVVLIDLEQGHSTASLVGKAAGR